MIKTFKYRIKPKKSQKTNLNQTLELCRWVYNETLALREAAYDNDGVTFSYYQTSKYLPKWKDEKPELKGVHSQVLQNVQIRVDLAFQAFFRRIKSGEIPGYPRFKGHGRYRSITYPQYGNGIELNGDILRVSKIGELRVIMHRPLVGDIKTVTIQRDNLNRWYVCFSCEVQEETFPVSSEVVGIDLGLKSFAVMSNGGQIKRQRWMKQDEKDITRLQRKKERYTKGSGDRKKVLLALNHAYQRSSNRRDNFAHQESRKLVNRYGLIVFEDLDIKGMQRQRNSVINRNITDVAWRKMMQDTMYKAESAGRSVIFINPRGTTQKCSGCGEIVSKDLSVRVHDCPHCGLKIDRDLNAAINILGRGLASIRIKPVEAPDFNPGV